MDTRRRRERGSPVERGRPVVNAPIHEVEIEELGTIAPPRRGLGAQPLATAGLAVLFALALFVNLPGAEPLASPASTGRPTAARATARVVFGTARPPATPFPWAWKSSELRGYGRGSSVANIWVVDGRFLAEIENDEGADGGPYGPVTSVLMASSDGLTWDFVELPAPGFEVESGTVADGRLFLIGAGGEAASGRKLWSIRDGIWRRDPDPLGFSGLEGDVAELVRSGECRPVGPCAKGWAAIVGVDAVGHDEELLVSTDGVEWARVLAPDRDVRTLDGLAWLDGSWYVIRSSMDRCCNLQVFTDVLVSHDLFGWAATRVEATNGGGRDLAAGVSGLAMVGWTQEASESRVPRVWLSGDGTAWLPLAAGVLAGRAGAPMDVVVATDHGYAAMSAQTGDAWISTDGEFWRNLPAFHAESGDTVRSLAAGGDVLLAGGRSASGRPTLWRTLLSEQLSVP